MHEEGMINGTAPALEAVEYKNVVYDGVLDWPSEYRGPPSDAIDSAWDKISLNNSHKSKSPRSSIKR